MEYKTNLKHKKEYFKLLFLYNAIKNGWSVKQTSSHYIFQKKHNGNKEIYRSNYLKKFIESNIYI